MIDEPLGRPDLTLTIDSDGVIRNAVSSESLADERLDRWRGRSWEDTVAPEVGKRVARLIEQSRTSGESACIQIHQRFPSGRETPIEYTTISLGKAGGFVAVGRSLQAISDLHSRLLQAQAAREQDYWKLREIETRYRALLDAANEAVVLVRTSNLRVVEANVAATKGLGLVPGVEFLPEMSHRDRRAFDAMLDTVRAQGRAPSIAMHLASGAQWSLRASLVSTEASSFLLFQMSPLAGGAEENVAAVPAPLEEIVRRLPEGFALVDREGTLLSANLTFLDLAQVGVESAATGQNIRRWLSQPGADLSVISAMIQRYGSVRKMLTSLEGELGSITQVEISAVGDRTGQPNCIGLLFRDVTPKPFDPLEGAPAAFAEAGAGLKLPDAPLEAIVKASVEAVERRSIREALQHSRGNRTIAAKYLGLSRQSLHTKLNKYGLDQN